MINDLEDFYSEQEEPLKSCYLALRSIILKYHPDITEAWKYRMPMFCYKGKMFCYLWKDKKTGEPYVGIVEGGRVRHPKLEGGKRARMKILRIDVDEDLPVDLLYDILNQAIRFY